MNFCVGYMDYRGHQVKQLPYKIMINTYIVGCHCCLWCRITQQELKIPPPSNRQQERSLSTLAAAHADFLSKGKGNTSVAKSYFNVIGEPFFNIPLDQVNKQDVVNLCEHFLQVSLPGLHISLGIFYRLFNLLEDAVHCLDFELAPTSATAQQQSSTIERYAKSLRQKADLEEEKSKLEQQAAVAEQVITLAAINMSATFTTTPDLVDAMATEAARLRKKIADTVSIP